MYAAVQSFVCSVELYTAQQFDVSQSFIGRIFSHL
jgi:hypothetical protein